MTTGEGSGGTARRAARYGALPLVALAGTVALENGERLSLAQAVDGIQSTFHVSDRAVGFLPAAMILIGVVGAFPFGFLADRLRRTALLGTGMAIWTVCMALNGFAPTYATLFAARLGVGAVEANGPAAVSLLADYYPVQERAKRMGLYQSGGLVGGMIGLLAGGVAVAAGGWRWAFWMWVPAGVFVTLAVFRQPEPRRGDHDYEFHGALDPPTDGVPAAEVGENHLPSPARVGTLDYDTATARQVYRELLSIRSMWFAVLALTISGLLLNGLQFWAVEYYKRVHGLAADQAGIFVAIFGLGAGLGVVAGGFIADRLLVHGHTNARVYVVSFSSIVATLLLLPAFLSTSLAVSGPLMTVGGMFLTLPIAPGEALMNDVVVANLRGRAATVRSVVRSAAAAGPVIIGFLSDAYGLRVACALVVPIYAVGGLVMLLAARTYPADVAYVGAETRRVRSRHAS